MSSRNLEPRVTASYVQVTLAALAAPADSALAGQRLSGGVRSWSRSATCPSGSMAAGFSTRRPLKAELPALDPSAPVPVEAARPALRVLVVEDNEDAADTLAELLRLFGYEVHVAYSGPEGVEAAHRFHPQVVLCDIGLPGLDGYGVARQIRGDAATGSPRLIAVTGYGTDEDRCLSRQAGFDHHMVKPVDPEELLQQLIA